MTLAPEKVTPKPIFPKREVSPLPWRWFEFREKPRPITFPLGYDLDAVYAIQMDGFPIHFKFLRRPPANGSPRPVLMLYHGMGLTVATFRGVAPWLFATHDLILPDYSGLSQENIPLPDDASMKRFALAAWHIADALHIERLSLGGNSLGGGLCLMAGMVRPQNVDRMVLSNPACFPQDLPRTYRMARWPIWGEMMMAITGPDKLVAGVEYVGYLDKSCFDPVLRGIYLNALGSARNRFRLMQLIRQLPANRADMTCASHLCNLEKLTMPILINWGIYDPLLAFGAGARLAHYLPNATYEVYDDLAHMPHEEMPERVGPRWAEFLNGSGYRL